jgi:putative PIN family toxin of toxin-antitoxin system
MRFAIDTNLLVSSTFSLSSPPALVMAAWRSERIEWVSCKEQLIELTVTLSRPRILSRVTGGQTLAMRLLQEIRNHCSIKDLMPPLPAVCRDPHDDFLFALHDQGHVDWIVSGDHDVLALKNRYPVLTARELIDRL